MENFIVSARKYRPAVFDTVVGQASITTTLKNAIKNHHLAQAFLFCGPRGVGKTTCARILAKTINCFNITENIEACNECESCKSFNSGHSLNVYELDAASNNSVDDIRGLVEQVRFAPQLGTYKIYIIDEVHMLSQSAFNAFLKTLEEPPKHAIFILATTEKHKIIPTILSRCQIFDFNRIQIEDIALHLAGIAKKEGLEAEPDALHIIAQKADGALRDALSIFDQIVSFAGNKITYRAVIDNLNILDYYYYFKLTDAIIEESIPTALLIFNEILNNGFDGHNFIAGLGEHFRNLLVCKDVSTLQLLEVGNNIKDKYQEQAKTSSTPFLLKGLNIISKCDVSYKISKNQRLQVELALMQLCSINSSNDTEKKNDFIKAEIKPRTSIPPLTSAPQPNSQKAIIETQKEQHVAKPEIQNTQPQPSPIKKAVIKATVSLNQFTNIPKEPTEKKEENSIADPQAIYERPNNPFTMEKLQEAWISYAKMMQQKGKLNLYSTLSNRAPVLKEGSLIEFMIENKVQEELIDEEKTDLLGFLRKELLNYDIQLTTVINKDESEKKPYSPQDKFKRMAEKNPTINKLRQQFDLDIDF